MKWFQMLVEQNNHFEDSVYCLENINSYIFSSGILLNWNDLLINREKIDELSFATQSYSEFVPLHLLYQLYLKISHADMCSWES